MHFTAAAESQSHANSEKPANIAHSRSKALVREERERRK